MRAKAPLILSFFTSLMLLTCCATAQQVDTDSRLVLTSVAPVFQITQALLVNTDIHVENIPARPRSLSAQGTFFARQGERFTEQFNQADAVITIGKIWPLDSFYTTAREANIRIVNIDASRPWSHARAGVTTAASPVSGEVSPYFWLSPANTTRMLNIVAYDLQQLYPDQAATITSNLAASKAFIVQMKSEFESSFIEVLDPFVYALADEFTYLTSELGIFVDDYFVRQDIDWTAEDLTQLTERLQQADIKVVLHKWQPSDEIQAAVNAAGAQLVILDLMGTSTEGFNASMANNLQLLLDALR